MLEEDKVQLNSEIEVLKEQKSHKEEHIESCFLSLVRCINLFPSLEMRYGLLLAFSFKY